MARRRGKVAKQLGIAPESLRTWVHREEVERGMRPGLTFDERARMKELERENRELGRAKRDPQERRQFLRGGARPPIEAMTRYIDEQRRSFGVEPICRTLQIAPSTYYAAKARRPSPRSLRDAELGPLIEVLHATHFGVYGVRKLWRTLRRHDVEIGRDQVGRLMRGLGLSGATRAKRIRTTRPGIVEQRPADLVERIFSAAAPNRLWVADLTYVWTRSGFVYAAFIVDAFSKARQNSR